MKIGIIFAAIAGFLYLLFNASKTSAAKIPLVTTPSTPMAQGVLSFFASPSPIIQNGTLVTPGVTTGPTLAQAGILTAGTTTGPTPTAAQADVAYQGTLSLTPVSPSLLVPLAGSPAVTPANDISTTIDYPGIQTYMSDPYASDPNIAAA